MIDNPSIIIKAVAESRHTVWDILLTSVPALVAVLGGLGALYKYIHETKAARQAEESTRAFAAKSAALEARKPFVADQQSVYKNLAKTTAILGNNDVSSPRWQKAHKHFGSCTGVKFQYLLIQKLEWQSMCSLKLWTTPKIKGEYRFAMQA